MKEFLFESCTICKNPRFWIDEDIISRKRIYAETIAEACKKYTVYELKSPFLAD